MQPESYTIHTTLLVSVSEGLGCLSILYEGIEAYTLDGFFTMNMRTGQKPSEGGIENGAANRTVDASSMEGE